MKNGDKLKKTAIENKIMIQQEMNQIITHQPKGSVEIREHLFGMGRYIWFYDFL